MLKISFVNKLMALSLPRVTKSFQNNAVVIGRLKLLYNVVAKPDKSNISKILLYKNAFSNPTLKCLDKKILTHRNNC